MQLTHEATPNNRFYMDCTFHERMIPKEAGFRWDRTRKQWFTEEADKAERLVKYADDETKTIIAAASAAIRSALDDSAAADSDLDIPVNPGMSYLGYQRAGINYAAQRPNTLIGDEMGLGKTIQALGLVNYDESIRRVLVVCPASLKINWAREAEKWLVRDTAVHILLSGGKSKTLSPSFYDAGEDLEIINYDILKKSHDYLHKVEWDLVIYDECHYCKNPKAQRTKEALGIPAKRRLFLTGTPILNRPIELWPIINTCDPVTWKSFWYFAKRYCNANQTRYGWDMTGASNLEELQKKLRLSIMVRRKKADVLKELPAKFRQVIELPANGCVRTIKVEQKTWAAKLERIKSLQSAADLAETDAAYKDAISSLSDEMQVAFTEMSELRHTTALAKVPAASKFIIDALESSEKVVVFAHHLDVIDNLSIELDAAGAKHVILTGRSKMVDRQKAVDAFQDDPSVKVFVGNIKAAGVGLTLTAASHVIFVEEDWTPGNITQAEDRCHRIGQTDSVLVQHLVLDGTLDATMAKTLISKQAIIDRALDNPLPDDDFDLSVLESMLPKPKKPPVINITQAQIDAVHENLRYLASVCDGASAKDHAGFNGFDTAFGKKMAALDSLTPNQAFACRKMVVKYKRQLGEEAVEMMFS
jgi:SWI/SNF-related matrix-associated actin-dependent regulator 1 of chromatin subfamily A